MGHRFESSKTKASLENDILQASDKAVADYLRHISAFRAWLGCLFTVKPQLKLPEISKDRRLVLWPPLFVGQVVLDIYGYG